MKWITKFFDLIASAYQASSFQETIIESMTNAVKKTERQIIQRFTQFKKRLALTLAEFFCYFTGCILLLVGVIILISRWISLDIILLVLGVIILYVGLILKVMQK
jgi:VIT1/CCC1 family predicted Fe2+/Mn2+ transporter